MSIQLVNHLLVVLQPEFVASKKPLALGVFIEKQRYDLVATTDSVTDTVDPPPGVTTVEIHVLDHAGRRMIVANPDGSWWARNDKNPYSRGLITIPDLAGLTHGIDITISTEDAPPRKLTIEIKRA